MKNLLLTTALATVCSAPAFADCAKLSVIGGASDHQANIRNQPSLHARTLWVVNAVGYGSGPGGLTYCGRYQDTAGIRWLWVSTSFADEPWDHNGWIAASMTAPYSPPHSTLSDAPAVAPPTAPAPDGEAEPRTMAVNPPICETVIVKQVWPADPECVAGKWDDGKPNNPQDGDLHSCFGAGSGGITYDNDKAQSGEYAYVPAMENSRPGDKVRLCLVSVMVGCPAGDDRGQTFTAYNFRTHGKWRKANGNHQCGGA